MTSEFYRNKKCLVAGGTGFVGGEFVDQLLAAGAFVRVPVHTRQPEYSHDRLQIRNANLINPEDCLKCCEGMDFVFHAAGGVGAAGVSKLQALPGISLQLSLSANLMTAAVETGVDRMLLFSSSTAYPACDHPVKEHELWEGDPYDGYHGYAWMRRYTEKLAEYVHQSSALDMAIVRPTAIYGPRDNFDLDTCHVIPALIRKACERWTPLTIWGDGNDIRDILHIHDLVQGSLLMLEKKADCDPINIGYGEGISVRDLIKMILQADGYDDADLEFDSTKPSKLPVRLVDTTKSRELLGFEPKFSLEEGLAQTIEWYRANPHRSKSVAS